MNSTFMTTRTNLGASREDGPQLARTHARTRLPFPPTFPTLAPHLPCLPRYWHAPPTHAWLRSGGAHQRPTHGRQARTQAPKHSSFASPQPRDETPFFVPLQLSHSAWHFSFCLRRRVPIKLERTRGRLLASHTSDPTDDRQTQALKHTHARTSQRCVASRAGVARSRASPRLCSRRRR